MAEQKQSPESQEKPSAARKSSSGNKPPTAAPLPEGLLARFPWLTFLLPMVVYMLVGILEPKPPEFGADDPFSATDSSWLALDYSWYPLVYTAKIVATIATVLFVLPGYATFPLRPTAEQARGIWRVRFPWLGLLFGVVGGAVWIVIAELRLEPKVFGPLGLDKFLQLGERSAFNPLEQMQGTPVWAYGFLAVRLAGLIVLVPLIEEFFLRGFLMRYVVHVRWWTLPIGEVNGMALFVGTAMPALYHPEIFAAVVWFTAVTYLMVRTRNIWECVVAHAVTNLVLGVYVITLDRWWLM